MNNKLFILLLFFTLTPILSFAQLEQIWEQKYGGKRSDFIHSIIENHDGEYVFVGQSGNLGNDGKQSGDLEKLTGGNEDVFFGILRKDGTSKFLKAIGRNKKESAFDVVQTYEGGYAVVGFSNSKTKKSIGKKDGWLMLLDHEGRFIWETRVGTTEDDEIKAIYQLTNGNLAVTGQTNKKLWVGCYDLQGNEVWTKESDAGRTGAIGNDIMQTDDASIIIIGTSFYNSKSKIVLWKLDENGKELVKPAEYGKDYDTGLRIAQYDDEIFCLSGFWSTGGKNDPDLFPISKNLKPKVEDDRLYEKRNDDTPKAFLKSSLNKHFFLTGGSLSHSSKAKRDKVFVIHTEESGKPLNEDWEFFGGNFTDAAYDIIETFDGDILLAGNTFSHRKLGDNSDGWVIKLKGPEFPKTGEKANIKLENIAFVEPSKDDILQPAERGYIVFDLVNDSKTPAYQISGKVTITNEKNLIFPREIKYGHLPANSRKRYSLPIAGDFDLENGTSDVKMVFSERNGAAIPTLQETINYKLRPEVKLLVSKPEWNFSGEKIKAEQPVTLKVKITNKGDLTATNVRAEFNYERNIEAQSEKNLKHGDLAPGATADFEFTFAANRVFKGDSARIGFRYFANEGEYEFGVQERYSAQFEREILLPVLAISNPTFSPQKEVYDPEAEITINFDVENKGNVDLTNFKGNFTSDFPIDFSGKTTVAIENLKIKSKQPVSIKFKPKKGFTREQLNVRFAYTAEQSPYNQEQSEDYNFKFMKLEPSLAISSFQLSTASQPLKRNQPTEIVFTITNDGRGDAEKIIVGVKPQTGVKLLSKQKASIEKLKAGESETRTFKVLIDEAFASESAQVIGFYESSIGNDEKTLNFNVEGAAPLVAIKDFKLSTSAPLSPGKEATILFTVKNEGGQPTEKIDWKISPSTNILAEKTSGAINSIAPGAEEKVELTFTVDEANTKDFITAILSIQHQSKNHPQSDKKSIKEKALKQPGKLEFAGYEIVGGKTKISRGETIELNAKVTNTGASDLEANTFDVSSSDGISILSNKNITVNNLKSKTSESIEIKFEVPEDFAGESFSINLKGGSISEKFDFDLGPVPTFALPEIATLNFDKTEIFRDETTNLTIDISNKGTGAANDLKIELKFSETPSNVSENSITITSVAPGKSNSKQISITPGNKVTGEELDVNISMSGGDLENPIRKKITLKIKDKPVGLAASEFEFTSSLNEQKIDLQTGIDREDIISFTAVIENTGGQTIENPEIKLTMPDGIQKMFENTRNAIVIAPGNTFEYQISFNVTEKFTGEKADFTFACKTGSINETKSFSIPIKSLPPAIAFNPSLPNGVLEREKGYKISTTVSNNGGSPLKNAEDHHAKDIRPPVHYRHPRMLIQSQ